MIHKVKKWQRPFKTLYTCSLFAHCNKSNSLSLKFNNSVRKGMSAHFRHVLNHVRESV